MDKNSIKKLSRQGAMISLGGFLVVLSVFGFGSKEIIDLNVELEEVYTDLNVAKGTIEKLESYKTSVKPKVDTTEVISPDPVDPPIEVPEQSDSKDTVYINIDRTVIKKVIEFREDNELVKLKNDTISKLKAVIASFKPDTVSKTDTVYMPHIKESKCFFGSLHK